MTDIIYQLYYGEIHPAEQFTKQRTAHLQKRRACFQKHDAFLSRLNAIDPALRQEMEQLMDEQLSSDMLALPECFYEGFRLGMLITLGVFTE